MNGCFIPPPNISCDTQDFSTTYYYNDAAKTLVEYDDIIGRYKDQIDSWKIRKEKLVLTINISAISKLF